MREGWKEVKIEELGTIGRGKSKHRPRNANFLFGDKYPFVQTADVKGSEYKIYNYSQMYSEAGLAQSKLWPKGTLCITIAANIADAAILGIDACFPDSVVGFIPNPSKSDVRFVKYLFDLLQVRIKKISQGAAQDNLSLEKIRTLNFQVPPLETQKKIASILSGYDDLIENNLKRIKILEEMAQQTYEEWFVRMRFPGHQSTTINPETGLPEGWEKITLKDICIRITKGTTPTSLGAEFIDEGVNFIKAESFTDEGFFINNKFAHISEETNNLLERSKLQLNDVLVSIAGVLGRVSLVTKDILPANTNQAVGIVRINKDLISYYYVRYFLSSARINKYINSLTGQAAQPNINLTQLGLLELTLPTKDINDKFHQFIESRNKFQQNLHIQNQRLREARDILLPRLMMGMVEV